MLDGDWSSDVCSSDLVLVFIGVKMVLIDVYKIPIGFSLAVVATFIGISIVLSLQKEKAMSGKAE
jgi:tellurite resistance protein TerC